LLTAKASRWLRGAPPEARRRFLAFVVALDQELRNNEQAKTLSRKVG